MFGEKCTEKYNDFDSILSGPYLVLTYLMNNNQNLFKLLKYIEPNINPYNQPDLTMEEKLAMICTDVYDTNASVNSNILFQTELDNLSDPVIFTEQQADIDEEQALIDDILIHASFVFEDDRAIVFIDPDAVHTAVRDFIFGSEECHPEKGCHILFQECLELPLQRHLGGRQFTYVIFNGK